ncbi:MAG: N-6 DNA methylase [Rhodocyclaceae bacterium]|nr:N-6 DNA methylase [Rhodocyclaceae bacterium]
MVHGSSPCGPTRITRPDVALVFFCSPEIEEASQGELDSKGRAFETFMTGFFRGEFGQYFTPRKIVQFIVDSLPISNESLVLDTSCGSV